MKIKSITDVITNSSSEVFIIHKKDIPKWTKEGEDSCCITESEFYDEYHLTYQRDIVCQVMGWNPKDTGKKLNANGYETWQSILVSKNKWICPEWDKWCEDHKEEMDEKLSDLMWVDIEDHYDWDSYETDADRAREVSIWNEYWH